MIQAVLVASFTVAQLLSAPAWGRFSDKHGRRPALLIALGASALAYLVFGFATSLLVLFLSRILQGRGRDSGGDPGLRGRRGGPRGSRPLARLALAATNLGRVGPVLGSAAISLGKADLVPGSRLALGRAAPGIVAAVLCLVNMWFVHHYLKESREVHEHPAGAPKRKTSGEAVWRVLSHSGEPASRLIWIYAIAMGSFQGVTAMLPLFLAARFRWTRGTSATSSCTSAPSRSSRACCCWGARWTGWARRGYRAGGDAAGVRHPGNAAVVQHRLPGHRGGAHPAGDGLHLPVRHGAAVTGDQPVGARAVHGAAADIWRGGAHCRSAVGRLRL
ncbi:MAG: MFS transporter [Gemmatimonadetes bacterium]|nr:MFS transporter [Gemmatimonadota bacterium]